MGGWTIWFLSGVFALRARWVGWVGRWRTEWQRKPVVPGWVEEMVGK
jgi:hypothetical protein